MALKGVKRVEVTGLFAPEKRTACPPCRSVENNAFIIDVVAAYLQWNLLLSFSFYGEKADSVIRFEGGGSCPGLRVCAADGNTFLRKFRCFYLATDSKQCHSPNEYLLHMHSSHYLTLGFSPMNTGPSPVLLTNFGSTPNVLSAVVNPALVIVPNVSLSLA